jgi:hypothetical protein
MKKAIVYLLVMMAGGVLAQDAKYVKAMEKNIAIIDTAQEFSTILEANNSFERIGNANPGEWLPLYYQSFCHVMMGMRQQENSKKDEYFDKAQVLIDKANMMSPDNSEIYAIKSFITGMMISVDPMTRGQQLGMQSSTFVEKAIELDKDNPRAYLLKGSGLMYRPVQFGGGKEKAMPVLEEAVAKFNAFKPANTLMPHWGAERASLMLEQCKKME